MVVEQGFAPIGTATGTGVVWNNWNNVYWGGTNTSSTVITNCVWDHWNESYTVTIIPTNSTVTMTSTAISTGVWETWNFRVQESVEQQEARVKAQVAYEQQRRVEREAAMARREIEMASLAVANTRAKELLDMLLTPAQQLTLETNKYFDVVGSEGNIYRIWANRGVANNIELLDKDDNVRILTLCAHAPQDGIPHNDHLVAQMLSVQADELHARRVAYLSINEDKRDKAADLVVVNGHRPREEPRRRPVVDPEIARAIGLQGGLRIGLGAA